MLGRNVEGSLRKGIGRRKSRIDLYSSIALKKIEDTPNSIQMPSKKTMPQPL